MPWFALGFVRGDGAEFSRYGALASGSPSLVAFDNWLLACAMLAIGLHTRIGDLLRAGRKPLALAAVLFVFLMVVGALLCAWLVLSADGSDAEAIWSALVRPTGLEPVSP